MPSTAPIDSHGTIVAYEPTAGAAFTDIAELGDLKLPGLARNEFAADAHNRNIDYYLFGILRRQPLTFPLNFLPDNGTHDASTGLQKLIIDKSTVGFRITMPASSGTVVWIASGQVTNFTPTAPVEGKFSADVTIRFSGVMKIGSATIGS
jgi:hypothetical protein